MWMNEWASEGVCMQTCRRIVYVCSYELCLNCEILIKYRYNWKSFHASAPPGAHIHTAKISIKKSFCITTSAIAVVLYLSFPFISFHFNSNRTHVDAILFICMCCAKSFHRRKGTNNLTHFSLHFSPSSSLRRDSHVVVIDFALKMNWKIFRYDILCKRIFP